LESFCHVMAGYEFLMQNYRAGDRICIFGFSRGAYTARGLAGMIHKVGLLPSCNHQQVPFAYKMYKRTDEIGWQQSNAFKKAFSVDVPIEFLGVWDTVNSVGLIPKRLPFTTSNMIVRTFRHAVSLDERRAKFKANLWNRPNDHEQQLGCEGQKPLIREPSHDSTLPNPPKNGHSSTRKSRPTLNEMEKKYSVTCDKDTDVEEVWFAGCHCDVGGGSVPNDTPFSLARIPLRWMIRECFKMNSGIMFVSEGLRKLGINPASVYPIVQHRPPALSVSNLKIQKTPSTSPFKRKPKQDESPPDCQTEEEHELHDALSPIYDQLSLVKKWWSLEVLPVKQRYQKGDNTWVAYYGMNLGQGRFIPKQATHVIKIHRSVKIRMDAEYKDGKKYRPKASFDNALKAGTVEWID